MCSKAYGVCRSYSDWCSHGSQVSTLLTLNENLINIVLTFHTVRCDTDFCTLYLLLFLVNYSL